MNQQAQGVLSAWTLETYKKASAASRKENGAPSRTTFLALVILESAQHIVDAIKEAAAPPQKVEQPQNITMNARPTDRQAIARQIKNLLKRYDAPAQ